ncbi:MAG: septum formation initiator family protein [Lachnospiraceae bacterium]|nr:septum formation initiator family protein [Lachnospiraceae bacterium]
MAKRRKRRASSSNRRGMACIAVVVMMLLTVLLTQSHTLERKNTSYREQSAQLEEQILEEQVRAEDLRRLPEYTQSQEYIEKTAREKFGLVYPDEILFKAAE